MVPVALDHPRSAGHPGRAPRRVIAQARVVGVGLEVGFINDVHADLVAQVEQPGVVWIVSTAHSGDVVAAHRKQIVADVVNRERLAPGWMVVVAVDAEDPGRLPVDQQFVPTDDNRAETNDLRMGLGNLTRRVDQFDDHAISTGRFG